MICDLFLFSCGNTVWTYASAHSAVTVSPHTYQPLAIERGNIDVNHGKGECEITMPYNAEPANLFALFNPPGVLWVTVKRYPAGHILFVGKVVKCTLRLNEAKAVLKAISLQSVLAGDIPNETYSTTCELDVFDAKCGASDAAHAVTVNTGDYSFPNTLTLRAAAFDAFADGHFNGGIVECGMESSFIINHVGTDLTLMYPLQTYAEQSYLRVLPGCDKTVATCRAKFSNEVNFGGCPFIPNVNLTTEGW